MIGSFPARGMIRQWLRAGVVENGRLHRTEEGTPQRDSRGPGRALGSLGRRSAAS
jgi:hypothetical protein